MEDKILEEQVEETPEVEVPDFEGKGKVPKEVIENRKTAFKWIAGYTATAAASAWVPGKVTHSAVLKPIQVSMLDKINKTYGMEESAKVAVGSTLLRLGLIEKLGRKAFTLLSTIPGLQVIGLALNAAVGALVTFILGASTALLDEQIVLGRIDLNNIDLDEYITNIFNNYISKFGPTLVAALKTKDPKTIAKNIAPIMVELFKGKLKK